MQLKSPSFDNNTMIPPRFTCQGQNINPQLEFEKVDPKAKSLALIMRDMDSSEGVWSHWVVWDIPANTSQIDQNQSGKGLKEGINDFDFHGYGGPCPPSKIHRYQFTLYSLDLETLNLSDDTRAEDLLKIINSHIIESCELVGLYSKLDK
jgi:Raf kinase inhibitor-like YbhB/YbcL family protein